MRILLAGAIAVGGVLALGVLVLDARLASAENPRQTGAQHAGTAPARAGRAARPMTAAERAREAVECERARNADPSGTFAAYPCWAREALSPNTPDR